MIESSTNQKTPRKQRKTTFFHRVRDFALIAKKNARDTVEYEQADRVIRLMDRESKAA